IREEGGDGWIGVPVLRGTEEENDVNLCIRNSRKLGAMSAHLQWAIDGTACAYAKTEYVVFHFSLFCLYAYAIYTSIQMMNAYAFSDHHLACCLIIIEFFRTGPFNHHNTLHVNSRDEFSIKTLKVFLVRSLGS
ncbi:hypothetical protein ACJX0J_001572, partial [Zea mays]